jgi:hypothetical protein
VTESGALDAGAVDVEALESLRRDGLVDVADGSVRLPEPVG